MEIKKLLHEVHRFNNPHKYYPPLRTDKVVKRPLTVVRKPPTPKNYAPKTSVDDQDLIFLNETIPKTIE